MLFGTGLGLLTAELPKPCTLRVRAAVAVCVHQHFPVELAVLCPEPLARFVRIQVIICPSLPPCASSASSFLSTRRNCPLSCVSLGRHLGRGWAECSSGVCCWGFWQRMGSTAQRALGADAIRHYIILERIAAESHVNLKSVCCLTAFLLHFFCSKSFKEGIS